MTPVTSSPQSQQKIAITSNLQFKTPEEAISVTRAKWLEELNQVPEGQRETYRIGIDLVIQELEDTSAILKSQGLDALQIVAELNQTVKLYNTSYALFGQRTVSYEQQQLAEKHQNLSLADKLKNEGRSFSVYHTPAKTPKDPYKAQSQFQALVVLGVAHAAGATLRGTGAVVTEGAKQVCKVTKITEAACRGVRDGGMAVIDATGLPKAAEYVQTKGSEYVAEILEERYGFPKNQAQELGYNGVNDAILVGTVGGTAVASNFVLKNFFKPQPIATKTQHNYGFAPKVSFPDSAGMQKSLIKEAGRGAAPVHAPASQKLYQLGRPNDVNTTWKGLKDLIELRDQPYPMGAVIGAEQRILNYLVPEISAEGQKILNRVPFEEISRNSLFASAVSRDLSFQFIKKDFHCIRNGLSEFSGLNFSRSFNLEYTTFAEPVAFWRQGRGTTLIKTSLPGRPIYEWFDTVGNLPIGSRERVRGVGHLKTMAFSTGRSTGELQGKGTYLPPLSESQLSSAARSIISDIENDFPNINATLKSIGKQYQTEPTEFLDIIYRQFEKAPGHATYGFGKIDSHQFFFFPEGSRPIGCLNTKDVIWTVNGKGIPHKLAAEEPAAFRRMILYDGFKFGLEFPEIEEIIHAYDMGLRFTYLGPPPSLAATQALDVYHSLQTISLSVCRLEATKDVRIYTLIDSQTKLLDRKLRYYASMLEDNPSAYAPSSVE